MTETSKELAARALSLLDLTNLNDDCTPEAIDVLCKSAQTQHGNTAAICIWPRFVAQARGILGEGHPVKIATVVNFPSGELSIDEVIGETKKAIADGADEIDLVIPYKAFMAGDETAARDMVAKIKTICAAPVRLKTILETGELEDPAFIRKSARIALEEGTDFIKTSTGKVSVNATPEAAKIMLEEIRDFGGSAGFKPAGGVRSVADAGVYLGLAADILGEDWAKPETFRFGASGLLTDILAVLDGKESAANSSAY